MTTPTARLIFGSSSLSLNDQSNYGLYPDFVPPDIAFSVEFSGGTSANKSGGAELANTAVANTPFTFRVNVMGTGDADIRRKVGKIRRFLALAEDKSDTLYLEFNSNSNAHIPLWGQNYWVRFPIAYGTVSYAAEYMVGNRLATDIDATVSVVIKGYPVGLKQLLASATGGVIEDVYGTEDGASRGVRIPPTETNKMTNPVFGSATYSTGWTAGGGAAITQNTNPEFLLPGTTSSAKVVNGSSTGTLTQSIAAGNTNNHILSAYVWLPDGSTPSSSIITLYFNGSGITTNFFEVGNGLWRMVSNAFAGTVGATTVGAVFTARYTAYVSGFQFEERSSVTPLAYGDLLGCAWTGTAHASTSTRTAARVRVTTAEAIDRGQGTIRVVWKTDFDETFGVDRYLFSCGSTSLRALYRQSTDDFALLDNVNTVDSSGQTFNEDDVIILHFVYGPGRLEIYKNGASIATGSTYTPPTLGTYCYIGTDDSAANNAPGVFMDFTTFPVALTAAEILNDYNSITQVAADNERVGAIPWIWTKDGDEVVDNHDDSGEDNFLVCNGVPGSDPALTHIRGSLASNFLSQTGIWINNNPMNHFVIPTSNYFFDYSGTVVASTCGGEVTTTASVTTAAASLVSTTVTGRLYLSPLYGKTAYMFVRMADNGANLTLALSISIGGESQIISDYKPVTTDATYRSFLVGPVFIPEQSFFEINGSNALPTLSIALYGKRTTGSGTTLIDYTMLFVDQHCKVPSLGVTSTSADTFRIFDGKAIIGSGSRSRGIGNVSGRVIEFSPNKYNVVTLLLNDDGAASAIADTANTIQIEVIPRYALL